MSVEEALNLIKDDPRIEYAEPNYIIHLAAVPNDTYFHLLWGMHNTGQTFGTVDADIDAEKAWDISTGDSVIIGVLDTGVDIAHIDLQDNIWTNPGEIPDNSIDDDSNGYVDDVHGWDFPWNDNSPNDNNGHGTHVSGTIAAVGNNGIGVTGICWSAKIMALKISEGGSISGAISALEYAIKMAAKLTSNSWGIYYHSQPLKDAIDSSGAHGMLCIAAAANEKTDNDITPFYPSSYDLENIIAVAATNHNDTLAPFSNWGLTSVDLGAPGAHIYSTVPGDAYGYWSGTSMATPHVAGVAALIWSKYPSLTHLQVKERIMNTVDPLPGLAGKCVTGGRLNAFRAIAEPDSIPPSSISDLVVAQTGGDEIRLSWTATGDDASTGRAHYYDARYSLSPINSSNFGSATQVMGEPEPQISATPESLVVAGLDFNTTYYFAIKAYDEGNNSSEVSNSPFGTTLGPPDISVSPGSLSDSLLPDDTSTRTLTVTNSGVSDLSLDIWVERITQVSSLAYNKIPQLRIDASRLKTDFSSSSLSISGEKPASGIMDPESVVKVYTPSSEIQSYATSHIAVVGADGTGMLLDDVALYLINSGKFASVTTINGYVFTPTLSELLMYDAVLVFSWRWWYWDDPTGLGYVLANFVDAGGRLMVAFFANATGRDWQISGRFDSQNYWLIQPTNYELDSFYSMGTVYDSTHPVMLNVNSVISGSKLMSGAGVNPGATLLADFTDGTPLVAVKEENGNRRVDISFLPVTFRIDTEFGVDTTSDACLLIVNALDWLAKDYWLSVDPYSMVIPIGSSENFSVAFDATGLEGLSYHAEIVISSNDPDEGEVRVPVYMTVAGRGDANGDFTVGIVDVVYLINYVLKGAPSPDPLWVGDVNCDEAVGIVDVVYLINYVLKGGPPPCGQ